MEIIVIDLEKAKLNTSRLVKRPVQVRGKDGKVFTRMQWVDPREDQPEERTSKKEDDPVHHNILGDQKFTSPYGKIGVIESSRINVSDLTPEGKQIINDWSDKYREHPELLYDMMNHLGVLKDPKDPRKVKDDKTAPIKHMHNMMRMKKLLREDNSIMEKMDDMFPVPDAPSTSKKVKDKPKSKAQEGGNTIKGILDKMSREEKYDLISRLGIDSIDPATVPAWSTKDGDGTAPIKHMRNMMQLKKAIELDPSILNLDVSGEPNETEKKRLEGRDKSEKDKDSVKEFLDQASRELKLDWASQFKDHELMKNRIKSEHSHINNMHTVSALKKILEEDPSLMEGDMRTQLDKELLRNLKITNKQMQKILIHAVGLRGIGDVVQEEKGIEWTFGEGSFARIDEDEDGSLVLSIVDTGKDGHGWEESQFPMEMVKKYLDDLKNKNKTKVLEPTEIPLESRNSREIWKTLDSDFEGNYTPGVGEALKKSIGEAWNASERSNSLYAISKILEVKALTLRNTLENLGMEITENNHISNTRENKWKQIAYGHMIEGTKSKNVGEYVRMMLSDNLQGREVDTWLLHESAKLWTPQERTEARKELIENKLSINLYDEDRWDNHSMTLEDRRVKIIDLLHQSMEFVPFDLMTDVMFNGGEINFSEYEDDDEDSPRFGSYYSPGYKSMNFSFGYISDDRSLGRSTHPLYHIPKNTSIGGRRYHSSNFSDVVSHEFAHAIDHYLTGHNGFVNWSNEKYTGSDPQPVVTSYEAAVERSNPNKYIGVVKDSGYAYHKDEWISTYEGRIYDDGYIDGATSNAVMNVDETSGELMDTAWSKGQERGLEHWSESTSRYANGFHAYREWKESTGDSSTSMKEWSESMHTAFMELGYGDDSNHGKRYLGENGKVMLRTYSDYLDKGLTSHPLEAQGYLLHKMSQVHPEMYTALGEIYGRGDFVDDKSATSMKDSYESGDYTRKSEDIELIIRL